MGWKAEAHTPPNNRNRKRKEKIGITNRWQAALCRQAVKFTISMGGVQAWVFTGKGRARCIGAKTYVTKLKI
jgi:hypothetical protein